MVGLQSSMLGSLSQSTGPNWRSLWPRQMQPLRAGNKLRLLLPASEPALLLAPTAEESEWRQVLGSRVFTGSLPRLTILTVHFIILEMVSWWSTSEIQAPLCTIPHSCSRLLTWQICCREKLILRHLMRIFMKGSGLPHQGARAKVWVGLCPARPQEDVGQVRAKDHPG